MIYGQTEIVKDLIAARVESGLPLHFEVEGVAVHDLDSRPRITFRHDGAGHELECDVVAGCDGFHGVCRPSVPDGVRRTWSSEFPFGWLGREGRHRHAQLRRGSDAARAALPLRHITSSESAARSLAASYVGLDLRRGVTGGQTL